ncbi:DUF2782 domain-containing protein [Dyella kyungheensis]|uniref:DUF2782 domain-containing protein n=1 Tax=Dyella kyungheensis TaxID=1242174 RepID=A0ABS2JUU9_9GAMM|nr:DUF2782 domain-containing protein [Dyella kyungheensis]MBM7122263.1 DUF2782 domain-containing protein [Dyella kyungheensis]
MKPVALLAVLGVAIASNALAQSSPSQFPPAPPPPGMNDPGVKAAPQAPAPKLVQPSKSAAGKTSASGNVSADTEASMSAPATTTTPATTDAQPRDANGNAPPQVKVVTQGDQTIQEYSRSGQVYMVVVTPKGGIPQTYMVDQKGAWSNQAGEPVKPVMYKIMSWGNSKPAQDQDDGGQ